jgi:hypothetical protein
MTGRRHLAWASSLALAAACGNDIATLDPGRVTIHRLNNVEYDNTVRDLLGTTLAPARDFPSDDRGYGFDNVADSLTLSPLQLELYDRAAEALIDDVFAPAAPQIRKRGELEVIGGTAGGVPAHGGNFNRNGSASIPVAIATAGKYRIAARAGETHAGPDYAKLQLSIAGIAIAPIAVTAPRAMPGVYTVDVALPAGAHTLQVAFTNDFYEPPADRNLWIDYAEVTGPIDAPADTARRDRIVFCDPATGPACISDILRAFARRAWRRPPADDEVARLAALVDVATAAGDDVTAGLRLALRGALVSPHFVFRVELDRDPASKKPHRLTDWELASRLSYFVWSTMPDDELFALAETGELSDDRTLREQVARMLADPRAVALTDNFAGQWLFTRALVDHVPDYVTFPAYDAALAAAMRDETRRYFRAFLDEDVPLDQFLTAEFTYVNDRLAKHYGLPEPGSTELVRVSTAGTQRRGLLTQGSVLTVTSHPRRTSPVKRGKWLLDQLLCTSPPPPPPGIDGLPEEMGPTTGSIRDLLEQHRANEYCATCHDQIDPLGFGLEDFDGVGAWRTTDQGYAVDSSGQLPDGQAFRGAGELAQILAADPRVYRCIVEKLYTYALGRPPTSRDARAHVDELTDELVASDYRLRDLVTAIVTHHSFRARRGEP